MTPQRWKRIEAVFEQALQLPTAARSEFLQSNCDGDEELRREVQSLLDSHMHAGSFIDQPNLFFTSEENEDRDAAVASGQMIGSYRVVREIGRGGMGTVYLAERADEQYQKRVAIKLIKRGMDTDAVLRHFRNERQILATLDHPNIARLFDAGTTTDGLPYFVMEYVEGLSIDKYCDAHQLSVRERLKLFCEVCAALAYAHGHAVIHRDIKSSNIVVTTEGVPKLVDFGIAKILQPDRGPETLLTTAGLRPMTPQYASPEQVRGERLTAATDIYSLGVVLYELLTGQLPYRFVSQSPHDVTRAITEQEPTRPSTAVAKGEGTFKSQIPNPKLLRGDLDNIVLKALRKEPERRYQSVEQLSDDIQRHVEARPVLARKDTVAYRASKFVRRNPALISAAAVCLLLVLAVLWLARERFTAPETPVPEKSIAVLPFQNLSGDPENAYFADGIQEEILTRLSRVGELKVISRTSTQRYGSAPVPEVGKELGVAHVLEASVQRSGEEMRLHVQLIRAADNSQIWGETYDRKLTDIFAIQSELATAIANKLRAKLTDNEQRALAQKPTANLEAYDEYLRAAATHFIVWDIARLRIAEKHLRRAVELDPGFGLAWARLATVYSTLYFANFDATPERCQATRTAAEMAMKLISETAEAYVALGDYRWRCERNLDLAAEAFEAARQRSPNSPGVLLKLGFIAAEKGRVNDALADLRAALNLDPRDPSIIRPNGVFEAYFRHFPEAHAFIDRALEITPDDSGLLALKADIYQAEGKLPEAEQTLARLPAHLGNEKIPETCSRMRQLIYQGRYDAVIRSLQPIVAAPASSISIRMSDYYILLAMAQQLAGDIQAAHNTYEKGRDFLLAAIPKTGQTQGYAHAMLALMYAGLGQRGVASKEANKAVELEGEDKIVGPGAQEVLARIEVQFGEKDSALARLQQLLAAHYHSWFYFVPLTPGLLRLDPTWDPLRGDPRFEKLAKQVIAAETRAPEKSIAVLPFENLSRDPDNVFFTDGVQDEILTALTRVADLKVISRTSVAEYKSGIVRDLHEIGQQLGVAHVLEGSVQRAGNRVRVNVQLVDTHTDAHMWAQTYDRDVTDIFAIQSDIAKEISNQLQAKLSGSEQTAIAQPPTNDVTAFLLYTRAKSLIAFTSYNVGLAPKFLEAIDLLNQAVARDPSFFLAYCQLAHTHDKLYSLGYDHTPARLALADAAVDAAFRLRPNAGEAHLARGENLWRGHLDNEGAIAELGMAGRTLPNNSQVFEFTGIVQKWRRKYEEALRDLERAAELDPRNLYPLQQIAIIDDMLRRYVDGAAALDRALAIDPNDAGTRIARARVDLEQKADLRPLHQMIDAIRAENPGAVSAFADNWFTCALAERDANAAKAALDALGENTFGDDAMQFSRSVGEGFIARMMNDEAGARAAFSAARAEQEKRVQAQPNYAPAISILGLIDAGLGRKEEALRDGRRAVELLPLEKDAINGMHMIENFAVIAAWVGEKDLACEQLAIATRLPSYLSYGQLRLLPYWDPLRSDPCFEKIVASLAAK